MNIYKLLKMLSSESKAKIIVHFLECGCGEVPVTGICGFTGLKQANVSKHIMVLREENILSSSKRGREVIYCINQDFRNSWGNTIKSILSHDETLRKLKCNHKKDK